MSPETKKKLLYGGGALASIAALVLFLRNKQQGGMPISGAGTGLSGAGGASSGTSANNAAALNAATALAVEQSRQTSALEVARLQANTALTIAGLQAQTQQQKASQDTLRAAVSPGGAIAAAAPTAAKGLFDTIKDLIDKAFAAGPQLANETNPNAIPEGTNPYTGQTVYGGQLYPYAGPQEVYGPMPIEGVIYDENKFPAVGTAADYFQANIGGGDSLWFGDNYGSIYEGGSAPGSEGFYTPLPDNIPAEGGSAPGSEGFY